MDAGRIGFTDAGCGIIRDEDHYKSYDASAKELFFKWTLSMSMRQRILEFFFGAGGGFRWTRKEFIKSGPYGHAWPDDDIEEVLYFVPQLETGVRLNLISIKRRG